MQKEDNGINKRICHFRKLSGFNQSYMAELLDMKTSTYAQKERQGTMDCEFVIRVADILNIDFLDLMFDEEEALKRRSKIVNTTFSLQTNINEDSQPIITKRDKDLIAIIHNLNEKKRVKIYEYAYDIFMNKRK